jgi:hypothetical protein
VDLEGGDPEERVRWIVDVLAPMNIEAAIEGHRDRAKILSSLRVSSVDDAVREIAMKCGSTFVNVHRRPQKNEEGQRVYTRAMLPEMHKIAVDKTRSYVA